MNKFEILGVPIKSASDKKEYRVIKLKNGLKSLLIHNPSKDEIAACALRVKIGSFDDPDHIAGLAHFLEHLLFMGSVKYPTENHYSEFISANGGLVNATTNGEDTIYYFTISNKAFVEGFDIFANLLKNPLLRKSSMQREREAVDSEYHQARSDDLNSLFVVFHSFARENHPYRKFECGNLKTLKENISDDDLHRETLNLFQKYIANLMYLTIQSNHSLDELQDLVVEKFSALKSEDVKKEPLSSYDQAFRDELFTKIIYLKPKADHKFILIFWVLPPYHIEYKTNITEYFSELFKNESDGGLAKYLRDRGLITDMQSSSTNQINRSFCAFEVNFEYVNDLTNENIEEILESFYSYIMMIKETSIEVHRRKFDERMRLKKIEFQFQDEDADPTLNVVNCSDALQKCQVEDILRHETVTEFDEKIFHEIIDLLTSGRFSLSILDANHENFNRYEENHGTFFDAVDYPELWKKLWDGRASRQEFYIEKPNELIAENFEIYENEILNEFPEKIYECEIYEVWHKLDSSFKKPKANIQIRFVAPITLRNTELRVYEKIYQKMLGFYLKNAIHAGEQAHIKFKLSSDSSRSFEMSFEGFNDKLSEFFAIIIKQVKHFNKNLDETQFNSALSELNTKYSRELSEVKSLNKKTLNEVLHRHYDHDIELLEKLDMTTFDRFKSFIPTYFNCMKVQMLAQGNIKQPEVLNLLDILKSSFLVSSPIIDDLQIRDQCHKVPVGEKFLRVKSMMKRDDNSMIKSYYQVENSTVRIKCLAHYLVPLLYPKAFDYLRNQEQLGYIVNFRTLEIEDTVGFIIYVQSQENKHPYQEVQQKITHFMRKVARETVENLSDDDFDNIKSTLILEMKKKDTKLADEVKRNWTEIKKMDYKFDINTIKVNIFESITKTELQEFFKSFTQPENARILNMHVIGDVKANIEKFKIDVIKEKTKDDEDIITDIEEFKQNLELYPVRTELKIQ